MTIASPRGRGRGSRGEVRHPDKTIPETIPNTLNPNYNVDDYKMSYHLKQR